jgi:hypothetical protein
LPENPPLFHVHIFLAQTFGEQINIQRGPAPEGRTSTTEGRRAREDEVQDAPNVAARKNGGSWTLPSMGILADGNKPKLPVIPLKTGISPEPVPFPGICKSRRRSR